MEWIVCVMCVLIGAGSVSTAWFINRIQRDIRALDIDITRMQIKNEQIMGLLNRCFPAAKAPPANRTTRTQEQKELASAKRKEWWARKKALEAEAKMPWPSSDEIN